MDRLLMLRLDTRGCEAEAWLNGFALARADAASPMQVLPVHEYLVEGPNLLELSIWPASPGAPAAGQAMVSDGAVRARLQLLLPHQHRPVHTDSARVLARIDWAPAAGHAYLAPLGLKQQAALPVHFPRWRWCDAPRIADPLAHHAAAHALLAAWSAALATGNSAPFLAAARQRTGELAAAYDWSLDSAEARLREHLAGLHRDGRGAWQVPPADQLVLRPLADGRLLECLDGSGAPALHIPPDTAGDGDRLPVRLALQGNRLAVLR